ncbi:hypothetical protein Lepil_1516 [Leptonema illini DSM 21528]|uniref:Uncharacterized protein n=2 Tax=Leptonema illini TaxID=183 RepID=H2CKX1_9LEPT|nr:hypothetical protein Lepil_1516 [Leptonema illini DSM 21528]
MPPSITDVVYFDWNVISYLTKPEGLNGDLRDSCEAVATLIEKFIDRDKCIFPFSYAHFRDIQQGGPNYVTVDLCRLGDFTRNWMVYENIPHDFSLKLSQRPELTFDYDYYVSNTISSPVRFPDYVPNLVRV